MVENLVNKIGLKNQIKKYKEHDKKLLHVENREDLNQEKKKLSRWYFFVDFMIS